MNLFILANNHGIEGRIGIHDIEVRDGRANLIVQCEDDVALKERRRLRATFKGALANHEKLMMRAVGLGDFLDPFVRDTHDSRLGHLDGAELHRQKTQLRRLAALDGRNDWQKSRGAQTEIIFLIALAARRSLAKVGQPKSLHGPVGSNKDTTVARGAQVAVNGNGIDIDGTVTGSSRVGWNSDGCYFGHRGGAVYNAANSVVSQKVGLGTLCQGHTAEASAHHGRVHKRGVVLDNGVILQRVEEDNLALDNDGIGDCDGDVAQIIRHNGSRYEDKALFSIDNETHSPPAILGKAIKLDGHSAVDMDKAADELCDAGIGHVVQLDEGG